MFNSTTAQDALFLSREILGRVSELDALCACVTFLDELTTLNVKTVSIVEPADPAIRTYKLVRRRADGRAYARAVAEKYGLTYERLTGRRQP
jgi:DNA mismatch repair protein MutS